MIDYSVNATSGSSNASASQAPSADPVGGMGSDAFMQLLLVQLRNQNPLEPMQDKDLMAQITQLNSLQELQKINTGLQTLSKSNQLTEAAGLIGKQVEVETSVGQSQTGLVTGVSLVKGEVLLWLGDKTYPLEALVTVKTPPVAEGGDTHG